MPRHQQLHPRLQTTSDWPLSTHTWLGGSLDLCMACACCMHLIHTRPWVGQQHSHRPASRGSRPAGGTGRPPRAGRRAAPRPRRPAAPGRPRGAAASCAPATPPPPAPPCPPAATPKGFRVWGLDLRSRLGSLGSTSSRLARLVSGHRPQAGGGVEPGTQAPPWHLTATQLRNCCPIAHYARKQGPHTPLTQSTQPHLDWFQPFAAAAKPS